MQTVHSLVSRTVPMKEGTVLTLRIYKTGLSVCAKLSVRKKCVISLLENMEIGPAGRITIQHCSGILVVNMSLKQLGGDVHVVPVPL